jgi:uroporphyrinogen decarboxylase
MPTPPDDLLAKSRIRRFLQPFVGEPVWPPPVWLMRQAGRYLPEYRETRAKAGSFLDLCYSPTLATEVTLQPIRRYAFDAAILFADILVVPDALGQKVAFLEGEGPVLDPITTPAGIAALDLAKARAKFQIIWDSVARIRQDLPRHIALIGFCGAPWTVATYMVEGKGSKEQAAARLWAYRDPEAFGQLIDLLVEASIEYLAGQAAAGADALQIFDSWAGSLPSGPFDQWVIRPTQRIVEGLRKRGITAPIIGFPRGTSARARRYAEQTRVDGLSCDTVMSIGTMKGLADNRVVQGNLDPLLLVVGGQALDNRVRLILDVMKGRRFVFNLGHGIVPQTPPENVGRLVELIRAHEG